MGNGGQTTKTTCPYCGVGCGVLATPQPDGTVDIKGDPDHPANFGRLCSKGAALGETLGLDERLLYPQINGKRASWDTALDLVAAKFGAAIAEHGADSVAFYASGQMLTEDYYVANKFMKGFVGTANIDTNSRLCMASSVAGHKRAFGSDTVPGTYEDLELADLVVLVGSNLAWCHPVLFQRILSAREKRPQMRIVVVDPRRTMTADSADLHLAIAPDGDVALFSGLLGYLGTHGAVDDEFTGKHVLGLSNAISASPDVEAVALLTGISASKIKRFYAMFAETAKVVTVYSQGVNQSMSGTDKVNAIINCHLATGRIGKAGMGPFSVTGQPNAMGGREVGGLANMLAAHMDIENAQHRHIVGSFWNAPHLAAKPGLKAVDMFAAVASGKIKALWIMATNPVDSLPEADKIKLALANCPFVVISDVSARTDTNAYAHVHLPAAAWGEKDGTVTNSERRISRQRRFLPLPGEARPDWWHVSEVAARMGFADRFGYDDAAQIFAEHAALSGEQNEGSRDFDISAHAEISRNGFDALEPFQWPQPAGTAAINSRFFADGRFFTRERKARAITLRLPDTVQTSASFPFTLNTGRIRDQWHTMTRTGQSPRLSAHLAEPFCEIHPDDADALGIGEAALVEIASPHGKLIVRGLITDRQRPGSVYVPMHWSGMFASAARVDVLVPSLRDAISGQPASKNSGVAIRPFIAQWHGFAVVRSRPMQIQADYWAMAKTYDGWRVEMAGGSALENADEFAATLIGDTMQTSVISYRDAANGQKRFAGFDGDMLHGVVFLGTSPVTAARQHLSETLLRRYSDLNSRWQVIAGRAGAAQLDKGAIICSCHSVGINDISNAIDGGCSTVEAVGNATRAGTNCGSCRSEIRTMLNGRLQIAAE